MPAPPAKLEFEDFLKTCTPLLRIADLEDEMRRRVAGIVQSLLGFQTSSDEDPVQKLKQFLRRDADFLGVLLALTNLSQEKFLRIITAQRFAAGDYGAEWGIKQIHRKIQKDDQFADQIARLFLEGRKSTQLVQQVADFYLEQLSLPEKWSDLIRDTTLIGAWCEKSWPASMLIRKASM